MEENKVKQDEELDNEKIEKIIEEGPKNKNEEVKKSNKNIIYIVLISVFIVSLLIFSTIFSLMNINNNNIVSGVKIKGIDVSGLSKEQAKEKLDLVFNEKKNEEIKLKYSDFETTLNTEILDLNYDVEKAVDNAISLGKNGNIFVNNYNILLALIGKKDIGVEFSLNDEEIDKFVEDIGKNIKDAVIEPSYYIDNDKLIITRGKEGIKVDKDLFIKNLKNVLNTVNNKVEYLDLPVYNKEPDEIDIEKIYNEVHTEVQDAFYTKDPFTVHPEVNGVDFNLEEAKNILKEYKEEYEIQLTITKAKITIAQIGSEAFPDLLATYTTRYDASDVNRTTNLRLACNKLNDKVVLPGETFSYNKTLGERTIAAGYKNAKIYQSGQVVDGLGGGICQISSTLYNAVLLANLDVVERSNHQFVTSYAPAGRDATVVYGLTDFKFKNTRNYAVRLRASVSGGIATVSVYGIKETEYNISISTKTISTLPSSVQYIDDSSLPAGTEKVQQKGTNGIITETYITKSLNGAVVSSKLLSKDTYNPMQRIILRGVGAQENSSPVVNNQPVPESTPVTVPESVPEDVQENNSNGNNTNNNSYNDNTTDNEINNSLTNDIP